MSAFPAANPAPSGHRLTGGTLFLLAGLGALGSALALLVFLPVALRQPRAELGNSGVVPQSTGA